ncbi:MAG: hypothetical protein HPY70_07885 [Firmicutes bacterium]|nr:hypothetical protein [Bacillota bacterium]
MVKYSIKDDTVLQINGKQINLKHNILKVLVIKNLLIVHLFDSYEKRGVVDMAKQPLNNIYAVSDKGDIVWNIKEFFRPNNPYTGVKVLEHDNCFTGISINNEGNLVVNTFMGIAYILDVEKKVIIGHFVTK